MIYAAAASFFGLRLEDGHVPTCGLCCTNRAGMSFFSDHGSLE